MMTKAINQAIHVMEHDFESSKGDVARALLGLKNSVAKEPATSTSASDAKTR
ncbi:MAG: hypothetical protein HY282_05555 [Nitrospirae bacterium]|nr:hypothetical protein [Candidatus Manganitrophaceae bacterium]